MGLQNNQQANTTMSEDTDSPNMDAAEAKHEKDLSTLETELVTGVFEMELDDKEDSGDLKVVVEEDDDEEDQNKVYRVTAISSKHFPAISLYKSSLEMARMAAWEIASDRFGLKENRFRWKHGDMSHVLRIISRNDGWVFAVVLIEEKLVTRNPRAAHYRLLGQRSI